MNDNAELNFLRSEFELNYNVDFRHGNENNELILVFSPSSRFIMFNINFGRDVIYLADSKLLYYIILGILLDMLKFYIN